MWAEALVLMESQTCRGCGGWLPDTTHKDHVAVVEQDTCYSCRAMAIVKRDVERGFENDPKPAAGRPSGLDGLRFWVRDITAKELATAVRPE